MKKLTVLIAAIVLSALGTWLIIELVIFGSEIYLELSVATRKILIAFSGCGLVVCAISHAILRRDAKKAGQSEDVKS